MDIRRSSGIVAFVIAFTFLCNGLELEKKSSGIGYAGEKKPLGKSSRGQPSQSLGFGQSFPEDGNLKLQSWNNWMDKRNFGSSGFYNIDKPSLALWKNWMDKRNFGHSGFKNINTPSLATWKNWIDKRNFGSSGFQNIDTPSLAIWKNWMDKRNFGSSGFQNIDKPSLAIWKNWMDKRNFGSSGFHNIDKPSLATWKNWMNKRNFGSSGFENIDKPSLAIWKNWMDKRNFGSSGFENIDKPSLAIWTNWMNRKRNFNSEGSFTDVGQLDASQFQNWSDWLKKRSTSPNSHLSESELQGVNLESSPDMAKRAYFGTHFLNIGNNNQMQSWHDWMKRSTGANANVGMPSGAKLNYETKGKPTKRAVEKRSFSNGPAGFGSFHQYFTDGLQDWRNAFKGPKRADSDAKAHTN